jgi:hypothetical protein
VGASRGRRETTASGTGAPAESVSERVRSAAGRVTSASRTRKKETKLIDLGGKREAEGMGQKLRITERVIMRFR